MGSTPPKVEIEVPLEGGKAGRAPLTERREVIKSAFPGKGALWDRQASPVRS